MKQDTLDIDRTGPFDRYIEDETGYVFVAKRNCDQNTPREYVRGRDGEIFSTRATSRPDDDQGGDEGPGGLCGGDGDLIAGGACGSRGNFFLPPDLAPVPLPVFSPFTVPAFAFI